MKRTGRLLLVFFLLSGVIACTEQTPDYPQRSMPEGLRNDRQAIRKASEIFRKNCAYCHGHPEEGRGERADFFEPPAPDFYEDKYRTMDPAYLYWRIAEGKTVEPYRSRGSVMPAWGPHFSDRQIWQLVAYLRQRPDSR